MSSSLRLIPILVTAMLTACSSSPIRGIDDGLYGIRIDRNWIISENHTPQVKAMERAEGFCSGQGGKHAVSVKELSKKDAPNLIGEEFSEFRMLFECLPDKSGKTQPRSDDVLNRIYGL